MRDKREIQQEKISIIVPVYGEEEYIDVCIESIVKQTYRNLEIILVDDGSPDRCPDICDEWKLRDERIKVIHKENGGLVSARQAGMEAATGTYVGYVDGDDWIEPDMYENMMKTMTEEDVDVVITGFQKDLFGKNIICLNHIPEGVYTREKLVAEVFLRMICEETTFQYGLYTYVWNKLFKKDMLYKHQMRVDKKIVIGEDSACVYPMLLECDSIAVTGQIGYHYRQRMNSLLRKTVNGAGNIGKLQRFYDYMMDLFSKSQYENILKKQIYYFYLSHLIMMADSLVVEYPALGDNFPFFSIKNGSRIIIYSAGAYGIHTYQQFRENDKYEIVAWTDPDYEQYEGSSYPVVSLQEALQNAYDYVVIASVDKHFIDNTEQLLKMNGVEEKKIVSVEQTLEEAIQRLEKEKILNNGVKDEA